MFCLCTAELESVSVRDQLRTALEDGVGPCAKAGQQLGAASPELAPALPLLVSRQSLGAARVDAYLSCPTFYLTYS